MFMQRRSNTFVKHAQNYIIVLQEDFSAAGEEQGQGQQVLARMQEPALSAHSIRLIFHSVKKKISKSSTLSQKERLFTSAIFDA
jgi:hypothetical protein